MLVPSMPAGAEPLEDTPARVVIQERKNGSSEEIRIAIGSMPLDPFQKGWTGSLSFTHHFNDRWAWEVLQLTAALLSSTSLRDELLLTFARRPEEFAAPRLMATSGLELTPAYGKQVFANRSTIYEALIVGIYAGVIFGDRSDISESLTDIRPSVGGGLGFRVYLNPNISTRLDARIFASLRPAFLNGESAEVETVALFTLSVSFGFGDVP